MKKLVLTGLTSLLLTSAFAVTDADLLADQALRTKINAMLYERKQQYAQYQESLNAGTGIFGSQSKDDVRRSNDILMGLLKTDDELFYELKLLLDNRAHQQTQIQNRAHKLELDNIQFLNTIKLLNQQVVQLKAGVAVKENKRDSTRYIYLAALVFMFASILVITLKRRAVKA